MYRKIIIENANPNKVDIARESHKPEFVWFIFENGDQLRFINFNNTGENVIPDIDHPLNCPSIEFVDRLKLVGELSVRDLDVIRKFHEKHEHGPDMITPYTCPLCDYEGKIELPFRFDKLFSFSEKP